MKTRYIKTLAIMISLCLFFSGCHSTPASDIDVSVTEEKTDTYNIKDKVFDKLKSYKTLNYKDISGWALFDDSKSCPVDVFLLAPTTNNGADGKNNVVFSDSVDDPARTAINSAVLQQIGIYNQNANVYAPYYNQVTYRVYGLDEEEAAPYFDKAYAGVRKAFKYFLKRTKDRPFLIAGFSQGSQMALRLMEDVLDESLINDRLVAAYLIGWRVTDEDLEKYPQIKMAQNEDDTGVIISYNSEAEFVTESILVPKDTKSYAINPLNWKTDSTMADKSLNKGGCFMDAEGVITNEIPEITGCYIDEKRGTLKCVDIKPADYKENGIYHDLDFRFFYRNLQENVLLRIENFLNEKAE